MTTRRTPVRPRVHTRPVAAIVGAACALAVAGCGTSTATATAPAPTSDPLDVAVKAAGRRPAVPARLRIPLAEPTGAPRPARAAALEPTAREALVFVGADGERITVDRIRRFLERQGSPLAAYAETFVDAGIDAGVDPRLVVAISGIESSFGRRQIGHNAWGWGIYGDRVRRFADWDTAIRTYSRELADRYPVDRVDTAFARRYCPPNWRKWFDAVSGFFSAI